MDKLNIHPIFENLPPMSKEEKHNGEYINKDWSPGRAITEDEKTNQLKYELEKEIKDHEEKMKDPAFKYIWDIIHNKKKYQQVDINKFRTRTNTNSIIE